MTSALSSEDAAFLEPLARLLPDPRCELRFENPFQLLIATQLSAQSTDVMVNKVTPALFEAFPDAFALSTASQQAVETLIRSTGFYRNKARHAIETARILVEKHAGEVPRRMDDLLELPGVARKTANVVMGTAFGIPTGITVDTHAYRVTLRWGWHQEKVPAKVEALVMKRVPKEDWIAVSHRLVLFGRYHCTARDPSCSDCVVKGACPVGRGGRDPHQEKQKKNQG